MSDLHDTIIGERIKKARQEKHLTQVELAEKLGMHREAIMNWERGRTSPDLFNSGCLCQLFDCDLGYLLGEYDTKKRVSDDICTVTGLSEKAAEKLAQLSDKEKLYLEDLLNNEFFFSKISTNYGLYLETASHELNIPDIPDDIKLQLVLKHSGKEISDEPVLDNIDPSFLTKIMDYTKQGSLLRYEHSCLDFLQRKTNEKSLSKGEKP